MLIHWRFRKRILGLWCVASCVLGCGHSSRTVPLPNVDGEGVAGAALALLENDRSGALDAAELSPGLATAVDLLDLDHNGQISRQEIAAGVEAWKESRAGMIPVRCVVTLDGEPLHGAEVLFDREPFLGQRIQPAIGRTNKFDWATMSIPRELRPVDEERAGIQFGFCTVRIKKTVEGRESLPKRFHETSTLGQEISMDAPGVQSGNVFIKLPTRE